MTEFASRLRVNLGVKDGVIPKGRARNAYRVSDLALQYQPIFDTETGLLAGLEALVRWRDPERGLHAAADFIHGLSMSAFRGDLAPWVLGSACSRSRAWADGGLEAPPITANVAAYELKELPLETLVGRALADAGVDPGRLVLEIPSSALLPRSIPIENQIRAVQDLEVGVVSDASDLDLEPLATALDLGVVGVTVDVSKAARSGAARERALAVAARVRERGIVLTGTRVDSIDDLEAARELACDRVQGYSFGGPLSEPECAELLAKVATPGANGTGRDNRSAPRSTVLMRVTRAQREVAGGGLEPIEAMVTDLAERGLQLRSSAAVEVGDVLHLALSAEGVPAVEVQATAVGVERLGATYRVNARLEEAPPGLLELVTARTNAA